MNGLLAAPRCPEIHTLAHGWDSGTNQQPAVCVFLWTLKRVVALRAARTDRRATPRPRGRKDRGNGFLLEPEINVFSFKNRPESGRNPLISMPGPSLVSVLWEGLSCRQSWEPAKAQKGLVDSGELTTEVRQLEQCWGELGEVKL